MTHDIRQRLHAQPFLPFTIHTSDGREFAVPTADHAHVWPSRSRVSIWNDEGVEYVLPALHISGLKLQPNGRRKK